MEPDLADLQNQLVQGFLSGRSFTLKPRPAKTARNELPTYPCESSNRPHPNSSPALSSPALSPKRLQSSNSHLPPSNSAQPDLPSSSAQSLPKGISHLPSSRSHITATLSDWQALLDSSGELLLHTAGTTGTPKTIRHTFRSLTRGIRRSRNLSSAVWGMGYDPTHMAGIQLLLQALASGGPVILLHNQPRLTVLERLEQYSVTHLCATPTFLRLLLPFARPLPHLRHITCGGETMTPELQNTLLEALPHIRIRNIYASTEAGALFASEGPWFRVPAEMADAVDLSGERLRLRSDLLGKSDNQTQSEDGWVDSGDRILRHPQDPSLFRFCGREGSGLNVGGYLVFPEEVEAELTAHPQIRIAHVYGRPSPLLGNLLAADCVARQQPVPDAELRQWLTQRNLESAQIPRIINWVSDIPTNSAGKIQR